MLKFKKLLSLFTAAAMLAVCLPVSSILAAGGQAEPENVLRTMLQKAEPFAMYDDGTVADEQLITAKQFAAMTDGDTVTHIDLQETATWNPPRKLGARFTLTESVLIDEIKLYAGFENLPETYSIYASDAPETLYNDENKVADNERATDVSVITAEVNREVRYIAFVCESFNGNPRFREIELWSGDPSEQPEDPDAPFVSENVLRTKLESHKTVAKPISGGDVIDHPNFDGGANMTSEKAVDGDTSAPYDAYGGNDWGSHTGVVYTLTETVYCGTAKIYSGFEDMPDYFDVYASDSLDDLYSDENRVASSVRCADGSVEIKIGKAVRFIAFFLVDYTYNGRVREFELWSAEEEDLPDITKVLTIGNSFAENASAYASDIAADQGYELMFGYIKYPSCTIAQHIENAKNNSAVYKFEYTDSSGRYTVKDGNENCATLREALEYTDWDIVVLQEGSTASENSENFAGLTELIDIVKSVLPAAEIMLHETWSWGTWDDVKDEVKINIDGVSQTLNVDVRCYNIMSNYASASTLYAGGAEIIHSGLAIELAREYYGDHHKFNDYDDGNYQHLNELGKYIAGAAYVATIFGCDIRENTFGDGNTAFDGLDLTKAREIVNRAVTQGDELVDAICSELFESNFIRSHLQSVSTIVQSVDLLGDINGIAENDRFSTANKDAVELSIDGDTLTTFEVYGALDWPPPRNVGVRYELDGLYDIESALIYAGQSGNTAYFDVYVSESPTTLYSLENRVATNVACSGQGVEVPIGKELQYIAFIITGYTGSAHIAEFDLVGSEEKIEVDPIVWPSVPAGDNLLSSATPSKIIAPGGDYNGTKEFDYGFMDGQTASDLKYLTDGDLSKHFDIWSLAGNDKPGVLYDLGAYYDISHLHIWAGAANSGLLVVNGFRIYASDSLSTLYREENLVFSYHNSDDTTNEAGVNLSRGRVRYIAFILTDTVDGGWRMREFAAYGRLSSDQTQAVEQKSIIEGLDAEYYGVATDDLADPVYMGASNFVAALTDGSRDAVEFWGGSDVENSKFVFIYNLYENYDLTGADIYAFADSIEEDSGIHKGIRSAKIYAARNFDDLFTSSPVVVKEDYENPSEPDETAFYTAEALSTWKAARYVAFVFTIGDSRYGACRLEELKVYGTLSAVQDEEPEEEKLPQYIDISADNGVVARIFALDGRDDLTKLDASLKADCKTDESALAPVNSALEGYTASELYNIEIVNSSGGEIDLGGRLIRLSIPGDPDNKVACVDDYGAEIISNGTLGDKLTVETETLRDYALVTQSESAGALGGGANVLMIITVCLGVLAGCGIAVSVLFGVKARRK